MRGFELVLIFYKFHDNERDCNWGLELKDSFKKLTFNPPTSNNQKLSTLMTLF